MTFKACKGYAVKFGLKQINFLYMNFYLQFLKQYIFIPGLRIRILVFLSVYWFLVFLDGRYWIRLFFRKFWRFNLITDPYGGSKLSFFSPYEEHICRRILWLIIFSLSCLNSFFYFRTTPTLTLYKICIILNFLSY